MSTFSSDRSQEIAKTPKLLVEQLRSFWTDFLADVDTLHHQLWAQLQVHGDIFREADDLAAATSIATCPQFSYREWVPLVLRLSALSGAPNVAQYGTSGKTYGDGSVYGQLKTASFAWNLPSDVVSIGVVVDHVLSPGVIFGPGQFVVSKGVIRFVESPFDAAQPVALYNEFGAKVDEAVVLWARDVKRRDDIAYLRHGAVAGIRDSGLPTYADNLRVVYDALRTGVTRDVMVRGFCSSLGLPYVVGNEVVEQVVDDVDTTWVITGKNVYQFPYGTVASDLVGTALTQGQLVSSVLRIDALQGIYARAEHLPGLALGPRLCAFAETDLFFPNEDVAVIYEPGVTPRAMFEVHGEQTSVDAFWQQVRQWEDANGALLQDMLREASNASQYQVNPMRLLIEHLIGMSAILVTYTPHVAIPRIDPGFISSLSRLLPAGAVLIVHTQLPAVSDSLDLGAASSDTVTLYDAVVVSDQVVDSGSAAPGDPQYRVLDPIVEII